MLPLSIGSLCYFRAIPNRLVLKVTFLANAGVSNERRRHATMQWNTSKTTQNAGVFTRRRRFQDTPPAFCVMHRRLHETRTIYIQNHTQRRRRRSETTLNAGVSTRRRRHTLAYPRDAGVSTRRRRHTSTFPGDDGVFTRRRRHTWAFQRDAGVSTRLLSSLIAVGDHTLEPFISKITLNAGEEDPKPH
jgi:hypothetical protein